MSKKNSKKTKKSQKNKIIKNKSIKRFKKYLIGGTIENVIFACTTLNKNSTFCKNFETINSIIRIYIPIEITINPIFIFKPPVFNITFINDPDTKKNMIENNYKTDDIISVNQNFIEYINTTQDKSTKIIVLSQCSELVSSLTNENYVIDKKSYDKIRDNLFLLYSKLNDDGYIINFYYGKTGSNAVLINMVNFFSYATLTKYLPLFLYSVLLINILFTNIEKGVYKKNRDITKIDYEEQSNIELIKVKDQLKPMLDKKPTKLEFIDFLKLIYKNLFNLNYTDDIFLEVIQTDDIKIMLNI